MYVYLYICWVSLKHTFLTVSNEQNSLKNTALEKHICAQRHS